MRCIFPGIAVLTMGLWALRPLASQSTLPMCGERIRTPCVRPALTTLLVRVGTTDTVTVQPGGALVLPIVAGPGLAAMQMTLDYAPMRVTLDSLRGVAPWTTTLNAGTGVWNAFSAHESRSLQTVARAFFTVKSPTGPTQVKLVAPLVAADEMGASIVARLVVSGLVVCVVRC